MPGEVLVRIGRDVDEALVAKLLELNDLPRWLASRESFLVVERGGELVAALEYRPAGDGLLLGVPIFDPFVGTAPVARALYAEAHAMAWVRGFVRAMPTMRGDYPGEVGYHAGIAVGLFGGKRRPTTTRRRAIRPRLAQAARPVGLSRRAVLPGVPRSGPVNAPSSGTARPDTERSSR